MLKKRAAGGWLLWLCWMQDGCQNNHKRPSPPTPYTTKTDADDVIVVTALISFFDLHPLEHFVPMTTTTTTQFFSRKMHQFTGICIGK